MAQYFNDDLEYVNNDEYNYYYMIEFEDDNGGDGELGAFDLQDEELGGADLEKRKNDTTAAEFRNGKDIQGIPWERLNYSRDKYREMRLKQYKNYESLVISRGDLEKECKEVNKGSTFYDFQFNTRLVKSTIVHFQGMKAEWKYLLAAGAIRGMLSICSQI